MPSGATHSKLALITIAVGTPLIAMSDFIPAEAKAPLIGGLCFGWVLTPDVDLSTRTHEERRMQQIPIFGQLWIEHWASYGWRFNHRGISHVPVLGTLTRLFWMVRPFMWTALLLAFFILSDTIAIEVLRKPDIDWTWFPAFFVGWTVQDLVHETADVIVSEHKMKMKDRKL